VTHHPSDPGRIVAPVRGDAACLYCEGTGADQVGGRGVLQPACGPLSFAPVPAAGMVPRMLTFEGANVDIYIRASAPFIAGLSTREWV
jgi:hypothetical protein